MSKKRGIFYKTPSLDCFKVNDLIDFNFQEKLVSDDYGGDHDSLESDPPNWETGMLYMFISLALIFGICFHELYLSVTLLGIYINLSAIVLSLYILGYRIY